jgi:dephospho-CoA kinase
MKIIGITGGTGSGKTSALLALGDMGAKVIDCDELYHGLLESDGELRRDLAARFPSAAVGGKIDRKALGAEVFGDRNALDALGEITHKYVDREVRRLLEQWESEGVSLAAVDAIALIESGLGDVCDVVVGVTSPEATRLARIMKRDGIDAGRAKARIAAQRTDEFFRRNCDIIIENNSGEPEEFRRKCAEIFREIAAARD